jgi:hypothetical protein
LGRCWQLAKKTIGNVLAEEKKPAQDGLAPQGEEHGSARFRRYFPPEYSIKQIEAVIIGLLKEWKTANTQTITPISD